MVTVHVVALGARTPLGLTADSSAAALRAEISRLAEHPFMIDKTGERVVGGLDPLLDPKIFGTSRMVEMVRTPLLDVIATLAEYGTVRAPVPCLVGLPETRPGFADPDVDNVIGTLQRSASEHPWLQARTGGRGHAAVLESIADACAGMARREYEICIVGGVDSYLHHETIDWLQTHRQLATSETRFSFHPGEGAAFVALATDRARKALGIPSLGIVAGTGTAEEKVRIKDNEESFGEGLTAAVREAARGLRKGELIDDIYCDINGERYRGQEWGFVLLRAGRLFADSTRYPFTASMWGDMGAASGALSVVLACCDARRDSATGPFAMLWGSSEAGMRAAILMDRSSVNVEAIHA